MKNIAIFGSSRSGKSTLAKLIAKKCPNYHIIIGDDIRWAFQQVLPANSISSEGGSGMVDDFPNFLSCLFYCNINRNRGEINYIIETCDITPQKASELFGKDDTVLLFLGTPRLSVQGYFEEIRKSETTKDWTHGRSDEQILDHCKYWIDKSKQYEKECKELNIWYVDTSFDREQKLKETLEEIEQMILDDEKRETQHP